MARWQSLLAIVAILFVAGALWPWARLNRLISAAIAVALIVIVLVARLQQHAAHLGGSRASTKDLESRIEQIRAERERRYRRR